MSNRSRRAIVAIGILSLMLASGRPALSSVIVTGRYLAIAEDVVDDQAAMRVTTGLTHIKSLTIVGPMDSNQVKVLVAYTTDEMQGVEPGMFQLNDRKTSGIILADGGVFIVYHLRLLRPGKMYYWEARGD